MKQELIVVHQCLLEEILDHEGKLKRDASIRIPLGGQTIEYPISANKTKTQTLVRLAKDENSILNVFNQVQTLGLQRSLVKSTNKKQPEYIALLVQANNRNLLNEVTENLEQLS